MQSDGIDIFLKECQHEVDTVMEGKVYPKYKDGIHVITQSEFEAVYGVRQPPAGWFKYIIHDWARTKTIYHANVALTVAASPASAKYPGFLFTYNAKAWEKDAQPDDCAIDILSMLTPTVYVRGEELTWKELVRQNLARENFEQHIGDTQKLIEARRKVIATVLPQYAHAALQRNNVRKLRFSHDRDDIAAVYRKTYGLNFDPANPTKAAGIQQTNELMDIDFTLPHPFKPGVLGYTRFFIIVPDDQVARKEDLSPDELFDFDLLRHQLIERRWMTAKVTETGERGSDELEKANDDYGQAYQFLLMDNAPFNEPLSEQEKTEETMRHEAPELSVEAIQAMPASSEKAGAVQARLVKMKEIQADLARGRGKMKNPMKNIRRRF
jgi:hypothetical protein